MNNTLQNNHHILNHIHVLINKLTCGIIILDENGVVTDCNSIAENLLEEPLRNQVWINVINKVICPREDDGHEISLCNGKRVQLSTNSLAPQSGQLIIITDLTHTRALQDRLNQKKQLEEMGEMTAQMAHQIRTPLATAMLYSKHLQNETLSKDKQIDFSSKILSCLNVIESQIKDMLLFSRGGNHLLENIALKDLIDEVVGIIEPQLLQQKVQLNIDNQIGDLTLYCNKDAIIGALHNLINNSVDAIDTDRNISFILQQKDDHIDLIIKDHGVGMSVYAMEHALQPFFTTKAKGTGLGLCVVQGIAHAHQGELWIESQPGDGCCMGIRLPINQNHKEKPCLQ